MFSHLFRIRYFAMLVLIMIFASSAYAFAAANVVPQSGAGDGSGVISGYTVTNVTYALDATDPADLDTVSFALASTTGLAGPATTVKVQLVTGGTWFNCTTPGPGSWNCSIAGAVTASAANSLHVVAAQ